jgi:transposase
MTTIVDLDTGQSLGIVDGRDHKGVGDWLFARPLEWRLGLQVVAIDPSAAFRKALRMWLPRSAVSVDLFHMTMLANDMLTSVRQGLSRQVRAGGAGPRTRPGRTACCCWKPMKTSQNADGTA